jgi:hypothetical protein
MPISIRWLEDDEEWPDDPSARHVGTVDVQAPDRQTALGPADRRRDPDRHRLVERFENADGPGELAVADRTRTAGVGEVSGA